MNLLQIVTSAILQCLAEHNNANNLSRRVMGLYLYASGAQRQNFAVLSHLGLTESYTNVVRNEATDPGAEEELPAIAPSSTATICTPTIDHPPPDIEAPQEPETAFPIHKIRRWKIGTLQRLSISVRTKARGVAALGLFGEVYDNINFLSRTAEQAVGHHGTLHLLILRIDYQKKFR